MPSNEGSARVGAPGADAERPAGMPARGWWDVFRRVKNDVSRDNVSLVAAGLALYGLLAAFPALAAVISLYGLFVSPDQVASQIQSLSGVLPQQAAEILQGQLESLAGQQSGALGFGVAAGFLLSLWSARKGMTALMTATNIAYDQAEERSFLRQVLVSMAFTLGAVIAFVLVLVLAVAVPVAMQALGLGGAFQSAMSVLRWLVLWLLVVLALAVVYRYAPDRHRPEWRWVTWGSAIAATLWLVGSLVFAWYVRNFGSYGETYGTLGGVVVLLLWFYLSGFVVVLGAEINSELEQQTDRDTVARR
jgi:membrane protein